MGSIGYEIMLGLAGLGFILTGAAAIRFFVGSLNQKWWILLAAASFILAAIAGLRIYQFATSLLPDSFELAGSFLALISALCAFIGTYSIGKRFTADERSRVMANEQAEQFRLSFENAPQIIVIKDLQGGYIYTNPAYNQFLGKKGQTLTGETDSKFFPRAQAISFRQEEEKAIYTGNAQTRDEEIHGSEGERWLRITRIPLRDEKNGVNAILVTGQDITVQRELETNLQALEQDLINLYDAEMVLSEPMPNDGTWEAILNWAGKIAGSPHAGVWQIFPDRSIAILQSGSGKLSGCESAQIKAGEDIAWQVWQSGQAELVDDYQNWPERGRWPQAGSFFAAIGVPLKIKSQVVYALTIFQDKPGRIFRRDQGDLLSIFAQLAATRLQNNQLLAATQAEMEDWKRKVENLQYRIRLEHLLAMLATHFIPIEFEKIDESIQRSLQTIVRFAGVDRAYLVLFGRNGSSDIATIVRYTSWNNFPEEMVGNPEDEFQSYMIKLNQVETIYFPHVKDLSPDKEEIATYLQSKGIKSFTAVPLISNRIVTGYLAFEAIQAELEWPPEVITFLKTSAEMFVNLIERKWALKREKEGREIIKSQVSNLEQRNQESLLISELGDLLQACRTADEAYPIIVRYIQRLFPVGSGALYVIRDPKDPAEKVAAWGNDQPGPAEHELILAECWALRRGRIYVVQDPETEPVCSHIKDPIQAGYMCVPLIAQGVAIGILHLRLPPDQGKIGKFNDDQQQLASKIGENIAVPLTNLKLRDELRSQAICDPLTKLYNRRYMEETLEREIRRANRHSTSVGIIMFDIDKMKPINDRFGHDAGDLVLKTLGRELLGMFRGEDVACRYGGDEFTIVLPEASLADVWRRAEQMRETIKRLDLRYEGVQIGPLTLSIGVAAYPDHGQTAERVLLASDAASYASKSEGGDRIMMGLKAE
ncbi:MAG TPA: diguanylate cyclase [Anaerolineaceae bacterium]|nr:diguanylate cyclase [Anaerolineaceae bacterium]